MRRPEGPQLAIATAIIFYHRFYSWDSRRLVWGNRYDRLRIASTCLFLAGKVEESPKKIKAVVIEAYKAQHRKQVGPEPASQEFWELMEQILVCERILLQTLNFDLTVEHAYSPMVAYVKSIKGTRDLAQVAWNFINDSLRTTIALHYTPQHVAASAVYLASQHLGVAVPTKDQIYLHFGLQHEAVEAVADQILASYPDGQDPIQRQQRLRPCVRRCRRRHGRSGAHTLHTHRCQWHTHRNRVLRPSSRCAAPALTGTRLQQLQLRRRPWPKSHLLIFRPSPCEKRAGCENTAQPRAPLPATRPRRLPL